MISKNYDKRDDFNFVIINFSFLDGDVPPSVCSNIDDFNNRNLVLTAKL